MIDLIDGALNGAEDTRQFDRTFPAVAHDHSLVEAIVRQHCIDVYGLAEIIQLNAVIDEVVILQHRRAPGFKHEHTDVTVAEGVARNCIRVRTTAAVGRAQAALDVVEGVVPDDRRIQRLRMGAYAKVAHVVDIVVLNHGILGIAAKNDRAIKTVLRRTYVVYGVVVNVNILRRNTCVIAPNHDPVGPGACRGMMDVVNDVVINFDSINWPNVNTKRAHAYIRPIINADMVNDAVRNPQVAFCSRQVCGNTRSVSCSCIVRCSNGKTVEDHVISLDVNDVVIERRSLDNRLFRTFH